MWAPNARSVSVSADFNRLGHSIPSSAGRAEFWHLGRFIPGVGKGRLQVSHRIPASGIRRRQSRPVRHPARETAAHRLRGVGSRLPVGRSGLDETRAKTNSLQAPISIYEVHLGSWMRVPEEHNRPLTYRETAPRLAEYVQAHEFHPRGIAAHHGASVLRFLGLSDHGIFRAHFALRHAAGFHVPGRLPAPARHWRDSGLGAVALPSDAHGLAYFDGTHLFEHADPRKGFHPDWKTLIFNYGRNEVRSFLMASAPVLAGQISHRRPARGCGRLHALPRLLAQARRVDSQQVTAAARIWKPSISCASSTPKLTRSIPAFKPSPKNPPPGPWFRGPFTSAAWASA